MGKEKKCIECGAGLEQKQTICPQCGAEQPVKWLVWMVYALLAMFVIGAIYRIIVP